MADPNTKKDLLASGFRFYSYGIVTEDKKRGSDLIRVWPVEHLPRANGELNTNAPKYKSDVADISGRTTPTQAVGEEVVVAKWVPLSNSNRMSAPDVVANETVMICTTADTNEFVWFTIYREPKLRRLETVLYAFGNLVGKLKEWTKKESYWFEVSTHDKYIHVHTSKSDGERYGYDVRIDARNGRIFLKDDVGNYILLDSVAGAVQMQASNFVRLQAPDIILDGKVSATGDIHSDGGIYPKGMCHGTTADPKPAPADVASGSTHEPEFKI